MSSGWKVGIVAKLEVPRHGLLQEGGNGLPRAVLESGQPFFAGANPQSQNCHQCRQPRYLQHGAVKVDERLGPAGVPDRGKPDFVARVQGGLGEVAQRLGRSAEAR